MKGILILSTNESFAVRIMSCLLILKIRISVMGVGKFHPIRLSRYCSDYHRYEYSDLLEENDNIIKDINDYCSQQELDIIIPAGIESTLFLSKMGKRITTAKIFPMSDYETLKMLNNKWTFTELMVKNDLSCPKTILINDVNKISQIRSQIILNLGFPVIIKPLDMEGGKGIIKLSSFKELETYILSENKFKLPLIIQEYIPGVDVDISILAKDGKMVAWTIQKWQGREIIEFIKDDNILDIGKRIISSCNYNGVAHIDMMLDNRDNSIKILECNPRFWGSVEESMVSGVNFPYLGVLISQNERLPEDINYRNIRYIMPHILIFNLLKNLSLKEIHEYNLRFIHKIIRDPLYYCGFIPILGYKLLIVPILELVRRNIIIIKMIKLSNWNLSKEARDKK